MKSHISTVVGRYKGRIKGWDVVNEAILEDGSYRKSKFYQILGEEFIPLAFQYAQEADPQAELYYNDYNEWYPGKRTTVIRLIKTLKDRGIRIDAIGMQGHVGMDGPSMEEYEQTILDYTNAGVKVMVTEFDLSILPSPRQGVGADISTNFEYQKELNPYTESVPDSASTAWTNRMSDFFKLFLKYPGKVSRVTMCGVTDGDSWKNDFPVRGRTDYPLLFDRKYQAKPVVSEIIRLAEKLSPPWNQGAFETGKYRNLFAECGYSQQAIDNKINEIFYGLFEGADKVYFEVEDSLAYISDIKNHDVRTEGMSYGMMIAVQFDRKDIFDRLWRWCKKYMQHQSGALEGYFAWSCKTNGVRNAQGPASDGELYYITALIFASNLWGNDSGIHYLKEAQHILDCMMKKDGTDGITNIINMEHKLITFVPDVRGGRFTDPSYHVPAFYEVWARWAGDGRADLWRECAAKSREYLHRAIHPVTGLNPDYSNYDGSLLGNGRVVGDAFRFDSWRVPMNIALDYSWACVDKEWQQEYGDKIQNFLYQQGIDSFVDQYNVDGTTVKDTLQAGGYKALRHSLGLVATSAAVSLTSTQEIRKEFIDHLWNAKHAPYSDGYFDAYYDGLLHLFAFMHLSGRYQIITQVNK